MKILKRLLDHEYRELSKFKQQADAIDKLDNEMQKLTDEQLREKTKEFKKRLQKGETLEDVLIPAFAVAREACYRVLKEKPYYVQLLGAITIHYGNIAEMKTGEGKTLTSVLPAYLNALDGKGVHIVTVNEYLATRDAEWMGNIHKFLGLTVGVNLRTMTPKEKQEQYSCDILYSTNNEIGFDYLRDNMVIRKEERVQRPLNFAIIDEVDSVLIDEARTPLIISGGEMRSANLYIDADRFAKSLKSEDYIYDEKTKAVSLTDDGNKKAEQYFRVNNLYNVDNTNLVHFINQALKANYSMKRDFDYVVQEGEVVIVDQFTGRLMKGRAFSEGLHQAIEAKEGVQIQQETKTLATITFQNLFRMYDKLSGMTGTAKTEEEEFRNIYNMYVISIPTNKDIIRIDAADLVYATKEGKYSAIIKEIEAKYKEGQPVLVGTIAVETSELISQMLDKKKIPHEVLNAKNHAREAEIIIKAGQKKSVTIATNMAGRGTDIKINQEVKDLGGLCVIGTERHEARRIDNQLRGRSGRQGDPGCSQFYVSLEDDLMVRFGSDRIKVLMQNLGFTGEQAIRSKTFTNAIGTAQMRVEGNNFDTRKQLLEYDNVMNNQREIMYSKRNEILDSDSIHNMVLDTIKNHIIDTVNSHLNESETITKESFNDIVDYVNENLLKNDINKQHIEFLKSNEIIDYIYEKVTKEYNDKIDKIPEEIRNEFEKVISLNVIDKYWMENINTMAHLREGIHLRSYAQENPLRAYTVEGYELFDQMLQRIDREITLFLLRAEIKQNLERKEAVKNKIANDGKDNIKQTPKKSVKVGRNDSCPCGSGKKYKQCCGK
ncbi:MAG: preprotein translocase subunit SecA [Tenericutes bacterium]|jgi:preprotein translocase subunit SecA|nr:preprotein translocase subunit SecA [Mycoplasmatota bacterium]